MNHAYAHCWEYEKDVCPKSCFRAQLTEDLKNYWPRPVPFQHFRQSSECPLNAPRRTNADRIRSKTDEQLAEWIVQTTSGNGYNGYEDEYNDEVNAWIDWLKRPESEVQD